MEIKNDIQWKEVVIEGKTYLLSTNGEMVSKNRNIMKPFINNGYKRVRINKKYFSVHRLVAQAFIPNPHNYPIINHKDECKTNNCVDNLEWCTYEYNNNYGTKNERASKTLKEKQTNKYYKTPIKIYQYDLDGNFIKEWESATVAARTLGYNSPSEITAVAQGRRKTTHGFVWKYYYLEKINVLL